MRKPYYLYIFLTVILIHGLSLLVTGVYWDGVISHSLYKYDNTHQLYMWMHSMGIPFYYYYIRGLWFLGYGWINNFVGFISIFIAATCLFKSMRLFKQISTSLAFFAAIVLIVFPGSRITMFRAISPYYFLYSLFFIGSYIALKLETYQKNKSIYYILRVLALILLWFSFNLKSFLSYYLILFIAMYFLNVCEKKRKPFSLLNIIKFCVVRLDFLLLPIAFWLVSILYFKPSGAYAAYNTFSQLHFHEVFDLLLASIHHAVIAYIWPFLVISIMLILVMFGIKKSKLVFSFHNKRLSFFLMSLGLLAIIVCIIPYVLVNKPLIYSFLPATRCNLLIPSTVAIFFTGFAAIFFVSPNGKFNFIGKTICILLIVSGFVFWTKNYLVLNAWAAMQNSFKIKLQQNPKWANYSLYWVYVREFRIPPAYADYAWSGYLDSVYGGQSRYAESDPAQLKRPFPSYIQQFYSKDFKGQYSLKNIDPYGCQAKMIISPGPSAGNPKRPGFIGLKYLYYKFIRPSQMKIFLNKLMKIENAPYNNKLAKNCKNGSKKN